MNYQQLVDLVRDEASDLDPQFDTHLPLMMQRAHLRIQQDLDLDVCRARDVVPLTDTHVSMPADAVFLRSIRIDKGPLLVYREHTFLLDYWPDETETGTPRYYTWEDDGDIMVVPPPTDPMDLDVRYNRRLPVLDDGPNQTNWLSENTPHLLQAALLSEAAMWSKDAELTVAYNEKYGSVLAQTSVEQNLRRRTDEYTGGEPRLQGARQ